MASDSKGKADILNQQYASVFTEEAIDSAPDLGISPHPTIPALVVQQAGVEKLLIYSPIKQSARTDFPPAS